MLQLTLLTVLLAQMPLRALAAAGGTSGSGDDAGFLLEGLLLPIILGATTYWYVLRRFASRAAKPIVQRAALRDSAWSEAELYELANETFLTLQKHWSKNDIQSSRPHLHPSYESEYVSQNTSASSKS